MKRTCHLHSAFQCDFMLLFISCWKHIGDRTAVMGHVFLMSLLNPYLEQPHLFHTSQRTAECDFRIAPHCRLGSHYQPSRIVVQGDLKSQRGSLSSQSCKKQTFKGKSSLVSLMPLPLLPICDPSQIPQSSDLTRVSTNHCCPPEAD